MDIIKTITTLFEQGGALMYPLAICLIITLLVGCERLIFWLNMTLKKNNDSLKKISQHLKDNKFSDFKHQCQQSNYMINTILLHLSSATTDTLKQHVDIEMTTQFSKLKRGHLILDTMVAISPMIGILGTVIGIILSFQAMAMTGMENPKEVTGGIGQALITTASGLIIAILALLISHVLNASIQKFTNELEIYISELEMFMNRKPTFKDELNKNINQLNLKKVSNENKA